MRIIAERTLKEFWQSPNRQDARENLISWMDVTEAAVWKTPNDVKATYSSASIITNERVVFNIAGNKYRLLVAVNYATGTVFVKFIGTHQEYDLIDAATYEYKRKRGSS